MSWLQQDRSIARRSNTTWRSNRTLSTTRHTWRWEKSWLAEDAQQRLAPILRRHAKAPIPPCAKQPARPEDFEIGLALQIPNSTLVLDKRLQQASDATSTGRLLRKEREAFA